MEFWKQQLKFYEQFFKADNICGYKISYDIFYFSFIESKKKQTKVLLLGLVMS